MITQPVPSRCGARGPARIRPRAMALPVARNTVTEGIREQTYDADWSQYEKLASTLTKALIALLVLGLAVDVP